MYNGAIKKTKGAFILFLIKWFLIIAVGLTFLPFTIVILLFWLIIKKVQNKKLKIALAVILTIPTIFFGSALVYALMQPSKMPKTPEKPAEINVLSPHSTSPDYGSSEIGIEESTPSPTPTNSPTPTPKHNPTSTPSPFPATFFYPTPKPTIYIAPTLKPVTNTNGSYTCNCSKTCTQISSCAEAQYQLNICKCKARDGDDDGIACDGAPLHCQN